MRVWITSQNMTVSVFRTLDKITRWMSSFFWRCRSPTSMNSHMKLLPPQCAKERFNIYMTKAVVPNQGAIYNIQGCWELISLPIVWGTDTLYALCNATEIELANYLCCITPHRFPVGFLNEKRRNHKLKIHQLSFYLHTTLLAAGVHCSRIFWMETHFGWYFIAPCVAYL